MDSDGSCQWYESLCIQVSSSPDPLASSASQPSHRLRSRIWSADSLVFKNSYPSFFFSLLSPLRELASIFSLTHIPLCLSHTYEYVTVFMQVSQQLIGSCWKTILVFSFLFPGPDRRGWVCLTKQANRTHLVGGTIKREPSVLYGLG